MNAPALNGVMKQEWIAILSATNSTMPAPKMLPVSKVWCSECSRKFCNKQPAHWEGNYRWTHTHTHTHTHTYFFFFPWGRKSATGVDRIDPKWTLLSLSLLENKEAASDGTTNPEKNSDYCVIPSGQWIYVLAEDFWIQVRLLESILSVGLSSVVRNQWGR